MISRQLDRHLPKHAARILDVGAGQGTQSIRLAYAGHQVLAVEPDPDMRTAFEAALSAESGDVRSRVILRSGSIGDLGAATYDETLVSRVLSLWPRLKRSAAAFETTPA